MTPNTINPLAPSPNIFVPSVAEINVNASKFTPVRLLLMGPPGSGKTYTICTTAPNVIVADFDSSMTEVLRICPTIPILPFYNKDWCRAKFSCSPPMAFLKFLRSDDAKKLTADQTLLGDSLTTLSDEFHIATEPLIPQTKDGDDNGFFLWGEKEKYFRNIHIALRALTCNVVVTAHEDEPRDVKTGMPTGKVRPALTGKFGGKLGSYYTDVFRAFTKQPTSGAGLPTYHWQVKPDARYDLKSRAIASFTTKDIPADFGALLRHYRQ